jgi:hypothetical protein
MNIFIIDNASGGLRYDNRWEVVSTELNKLESVNKVFLIKEHKNNDYQFKSFHSMSALAPQIINCLRKHTKNGDIYIFANARDSLAVLLKEYCTEINLDIIIIGFWNDGTFHNYGNLRTKHRGHDFSWLTRFEKSLVGAYSFNLISVENKIHSFEEFYRPNKKDVYQYCPLPFDNALYKTKEEVNALDIDKSDIIVTNTTPTAIHENKLYDSFKREFEQYNVISLYDANLSVGEYRRLLKRSKIMLSLNTSDTDPYFTVESVALGCIPILPDIPIYQDMFDAQFLYPNKIIQPPYLNFIRGIDFISEKIRIIENNFVSLSNNDNTDKIIKKYFDSQPLKNLINSL